jgi:hypothetical protein
VGEEGEMTQTLYAHMNKRRRKQVDGNKTQISFTL